MPDLRIDEQIIVAIRKISQAVDTHSRFLWQEYGLTAPQLGTLRELQRFQQSTPSQLADRLHLSAPTMAGVLKRLEARGLLVRCRDSHDRRSFVLTITEEGRQLAGKAPSLLRDRFRQQLGRLAQWEQTQVLATLQRVASMMSADDVDETPFLYHEPESMTGSIQEVNAGGGYTASPATAEPSP